MRDLASNPIFYLTILFAVVVMTIPSCSDPRVVLWGHINGEAINHYWMFWRSLQDGVVSNWPEGVNLPLMDPTNLIFYLPGHWFGGPVLGYNMVILGNAILTFAGVSYWAQCFGRRQHAVLVGLMMVLSPAGIALRQFGMTELMGVGWFALYLSCLWREKYAVWRRILLLAFWYCGVYPAFFSVIIGGILASFPKYRVALLKDFGLVVILSFPFFLHMRAAQDIWWARLGSEIHLPYREDWLYQHFYGADFLAWVHPLMSFEKPSNTVFGGCVMTLLFLWRAFNVHRVFWLGWFCVLLFLVGPWPRVMGHQIGIPGPVWGLQFLLSDLKGIQHWHRLIYLGTLLWAPALMLALRQLEKYRVALFCIIVGEQIFFTSYLNTSIDVKIPDIYEEIGEGNLLEFPLEYPKSSSRSPFVRHSNLWQPLHQQPVWMNYEEDNLLLKNNDLFDLNKMCFKYSFEDVRLKPDGLRDWDWFILSSKDCPNAIQLVQFLIQDLGPPAHSDSNYRVWENPNRKPE